MKKNPAVVQANIRHAKMEMTRYYSHSSRKAKASGTGSSISFPKFTPPRFILHRIQSCDPIGSLGSKYVMELRAVNCKSGDMLAEEQVTAGSKEEVLDVLGGAASRVRRELGESLATVQRFGVPLEQATTSSLEALQALSLIHSRNRTHPL
jgi:hypothetical protein